MGMEFYRYSFSQATEIYDGIEDRKKLSSSRAFYGNMEQATVISF